MHNWGGHKIWDGCSACAQFNKRTEPIDAAQRCRIIGIYRNFIGCARNQQQILNGPMQSHLSYIPIISEILMHRILSSAVHTIIVVSEVSLTTRSSRHLPQRIRNSSALYNSTSTLFTLKSFNISFFRFLNSQK